MVTKSTDGVRDDTIDSFASDSADRGDSLGLHLSGATPADVIVKRTWVVTPSDVQQCSFVGIVENMDIIGDDPIRDYLMGIGWG